MTRYIMCRPECGLNDMLNQIELACTYAKNTDRVVVVDTNHASSKHFCDDLGYYFSSVDSNLHLSVEPYVELFDSIDVYTPFLNGRVSNYDIENSEQYSCWVESKFKLPVHIDYKMNYAESLVVHQYFGGGSVGINALRRLRLQHWLVDALHERLERIGGQYSSLHIRNTDIASNYKGVLQSLRTVDYGDKLFLSTDSREVVDAYKNELGDRIITFTELPQDNAPLHYLPKNPRQSNTDAILDLLTLACSKIVYITELQNCNYSKLSGYSVLASNLNANKDVMRNLINDSRIKI